MAARYARQGSRTTTQVVAPAQTFDVRTRVSLPKGARIVSLPKSGNLRGERALSFSAHAESDADHVVLTRALRLPIARITPEAYAGFAAFCRGADALESSELVLELPDAG